MILEIKKQEKQTNAAWREHNCIVRGNPVRTYEGERFILKKRQ
jgi:peptide chain release factor